MNTAIKLGVVIVTYNRLDKLIQTLRAYDEQTVSPYEIIVVNNCSTDNTLDYLNKWKNVSRNYKKIIITTEKNIGGSGGFYMGEKYVQDHENLDWLMISDDDAYPCNTYIEGMIDYIKGKDCSKVAIVCGRVDEYGNCQNIHRSIWTSSWNWDYHQPVPLDWYNKELFYADFASYVGIVINLQIMNKAGLVDPLFFIWNDDSEHTFRLRKFGNIICIPRYFMTHDVNIENNALNWKMYYSFRNKTVFFRRHFPVKVFFIIGFLLFKTLLCTIKGRSYTEVVMRFRAIYNGIVNRLGLHSVYKPGWKPKS